MSAVTVRRIALSASAIVAAATLSACGPAPWSVGDGGASASPSAMATIAPPVSNDLSGGSTKRKLEAGAVSADLNYWSTLLMDRWTPSAIKPISMSMTTMVTPNDGKGVYLQRATMQATPGNASGTLAPLDPQVDASQVQPGYFVLSPDSYSQTFNVGAVPAEATFVTIQFTYEFLVQTTPTSTQYAKQTATDTLTVAIAGGGASPAG